MPAHKSCGIEYSFRWKRNYRHTHSVVFERDGKLKKKFKCKFEAFLAVESTIYLYVKVSELNTLSDGKGITGIHTVFFNEMEKKKKKIKI